MTTLDVAPEPALALVNPQDETPLRLASIPNASEVAFDAIRRAIVAGRLAPGERLREVALAKQLGISATPVREALARLQQEGLVQVEPRRGAVVPRLGTHDILEVYELRELLEAHAARRAAERHAQPMQQALLARLQEIVERAEALVRERRPADYNHLDIEFHQTLMQMADNQRMQRIFAGVHAQVQAVRLRAINLPGRPGKSQEEHRRLVSAIRAGNADRAETEVRRHISSVKDEVLAQLETGGAADPAKGRSARKRLAPGA